MLKKIVSTINGDVAFGFFCAGVFWLGVLGWATSYLPTTAEKKDCYDSAAKSGRNTSECESFWERTTSDPVAAFTLVLAFSTVGLWVVTLSLYRSGERHSERELRAYIVATIEASVRNFHTVEKPKIMLRFVNAGKTPAWNVRVATTSAVAVFPLEERPVIPDRPASPEDSVGVVGPGGDFFIESESDLPVTPDERHSVINGRCAFYVYGEVFYTDAFGKDRRTSFCHMLLGDVRGPQLPLGSYYKWNEAS